MPTFVQRISGVTARPGAPVLNIFDTASGLLLDYGFDGLRATVTNGGSVTSVNPVAGTLNEALDTSSTNPSRPTLVHAGPGGHAALKGNGTQTIGTGDNTSPLLLAAGAPLTMALVVKSVAHQGTGSNNRLISVPNDQGGDGFRAIGTNSNGTTRATSGNGTTSADVNGTTAIFGTWVTYMVTMAADTLTVYLNGSQIAQGAAPLGAMRGIRLFASAGATPAASTFANAEIARVRFYGRALTSGDVRALHSEWASTYAL